MRWLLMCMVLLSLLGCNSAKNPVIEDGVTVYTRYYENDQWVEQESRIGVLATTAQRRVVLVNPEGDMCAEPSPDAVDDLISSVTGTFNLSGEGTAAEKEAAIQAAAEFASNVATSAQFLIERSQGVQLFRDGSFALCILHANGNIGEDTYAQELTDLREDAVSLIEIELPILAERRSKHLNDAQLKKDFDKRVDELKKLQEVKPLMLPEPQ